MPRFEVQGKHYETGKQETRTYDADDEFQAVKYGLADGLTVEKTTLIKNIPYTAIPALSAKDQKFNRRIDAIASIFEKDTKEAPKKKKCKYCAMMVPREARICPFCQKKPGTPGIPTSAVLFFVFVMMFIVMSIISGGKTPRSTSNDTTPAPRTVSKPAPALIKNIISYRLLEKKDISYGTVNRKSYKILLDTGSTPSNEEVKDVSIRAWKDNPISDEAVVWAYLPGMNSQSFAYSTAEFNRHGITNISISEGKIPRSTSKDSPPATRENSGLATTSDSAIACFAESALDDMTKFTGAGDRASFNAYVDQRKCIVMKGGVDVTIVQYPGMLGGTTGFVYNGVKMWTTRSGLTNYR
ncbi:MAG: hypothetical protein WCJ37_03675 [Syntrophus sp. (in: bacteria)]